MTNLQQIKQVSAELYLNLDNPQSVRQQLKRINQAQIKLNQFKQQVNTKLKEMKQPETTFGLDEVAAIGLHIFGEHHLANHVTRKGNRAERRDQQQHQKAWQPQIKMKELIDNYIFEGDRLKTMGNNYLQDHQ
jgi:predicted XRE-type DNA-binding protein